VEERTYPEGASPLWFLPLRVVPRRLTVLYDLRVFRSRLRADKRATARCCVLLSPPFERRPIVACSPRSLSATRLSAVRHALSSLPPSTSIVSGIQERVLCLIGFLRALFIWLPSGFDLHRQLRKGRRGTLFYNKCCVFEIEGSLRPSGLFFASPSSVSARPYRPSPRFPLPPSVSTQLSLFL